MQDFGALIRRIGQAWVGFASHIKFVYEVKSAAVWGGLPLNPALLFYCLVKFIYTFDGTQLHRHHDNTDSG